MKTGSCINMSVVDPLMDILRKGPNIPLLIVKSV